MWACHGPQNEDDHEGTHSVITSKLITTFKITRTSLVSVIMARKHTLKLFDFNVMLVIMCYNKIKKSCESKHGAEDYLIVRGKSFCMIIICSIRAVMITSVE